MKYKCGLCSISPGSESPVGSREEIVQHIKDHGTDDIDLYLDKAIQQTTLC